MWITAAQDFSVQHVRQVDVGTKDGGTSGFQDSVVAGDAPPDGGKPLFRDVLEFGAGRGDLLQEDFVVSCVITF